MPMETHHEGMPAAKTAVPSIGSNTHCRFASRLVLVFDVSLIGPTEGTTGATYNFNASLTPGSTALPVDYYWTADDQTPQDHPGQGGSDSAAFTWSTPGIKTIALTASIKGASVTVTYDIQIDVAPQPEEHLLYLPVMRR